MKRQLAPIIAALDQTYEFVFVDGEIERDAAPGVPEQVPGPFFSYYKGLEGGQIRDACDLVDLIVEEEGPFEGFIGFSQGAAVGMSYMLDRAINRPDEGCPFRWSLLFSCVLAFSPDPSYLDFEFAMFDAQNELDKAKENSSSFWKRSKDNKPKTAANAKIPENKATMLKNQASRLAFKDEYTVLIKACVAFAETQGRSNGLAAFDKVSSQFTGDEIIADGSSIPRFYHPLLTSERIAIPSVFCTGKSEFSDSLRQSSLTRKLCEDGMVVSLDHRGGHEIPREPAAIQAVIAATKKAIEQSQWVNQRAVL